ncbi:MAG: dihydrolipoamide acetyltransferase family protein [Chloroflexota bacterium]
MVHPILMPKPGQMTEECVVVAWHKNEGDPVHRGDVLFEIETDKSVMDVEAFDEGVLLRRLVEVGETVPVNTVCAYVGMPGEDIPEAPPEAAPAPATPVEPVATIPAAAAAPPAPVAPATPTDMSARLRISPRAARLAADAGLDPRAVAGTGPEGRVVERDVRAAMAARDIATAAPTPGTAAPVSPAAAAPTPVAFVAAVDGEEEPRPLSRMRRVIAERLTQSFATIPHFTVTVAVDVTRLLALREELKAAGRSYTVTDFILLATAQTLAEMPDVNSRTDGVSVWTRRRVHLGLAVTVPAGLVVPVIRDADRLAIDELHGKAAALAAAARDGTLPVDDMTGSTFTVSNLGMFGVEEFSAIINPGEAAILAVASAVPTPVALGDGIAVRSVMKLTLSADHRLVDGELGARFLGAIRRRLEDAASLRRDVGSA